MELSTCFIFELFSYFKPFSHKLDAKSETVVSTVLPLVVYGIAADVRNWLLQSDNVTFFPISDRSLTKTTPY